MGPYVLPKNGLLRKPKSRRSRFYALGVLLFVVLVGCIVALTDKHPAALAQQKTHINSNAEAIVTFKDPPCSNPCRRFHDFGKGRLEESLEYSYLDDRTLGIYSCNYTGEYVNGELTSVHWSVERVGRTTTVQRYTAHKQDESWKRIEHIFSQENVQEHIPDLRCNRTSNRSK